MIPKVGDLITVSAYPGKYFQVSKLTEMDFHVRGQTKTEMLIDFIDVETGEYAGTCGPDNAAVISPQN